MSELSVVVCKGPVCSVNGASDLEAWCRDLEAAALPISHQVGTCTGNCSESPVVTWNGCYVTECSPEVLTTRLIEDGLM